MDATSEGEAHLRLYMRYPYLFYSDTIKHMPVFKDLKGDPFVADLSSKTELLDGIDVRDQVKFQKILEEKMQGTYHWGCHRIWKIVKSFLLIVLRWLRSNAFFIWVWM